MYAEVYSRLVSAARADDRVRALWLSGSLARGDADWASDLDAIVAVADERFDEFAEAWRAWLDAFAAPLIARPIPGAAGSFYSVRADRARLDVVVERASATAESAHRHRLLVFDHDGLDAGVPAPEPPAGPSRERLEQLVEEFFRDYGLFPVVKERRDVLLGLEATQLIRWLLYQLFAETNAPLPVTGIKQWSAKLTEAQRRTLERLPLGSGDWDDMVAAHEATACAFVAHARAACADHGVPWPHELEESTLLYLRRHRLPALDACRDA